MPDIGGTYKTANGNVLLSVTVGDAGLGTTDISVIDVRAGTITPVTFPEPPNNPQGLNLGAGPTLVGKTVHVSTGVTPNPAAQWLSCTVGLSGGGADQAFPQALRVVPPAAAGGPIPVIFSFVITFT